MKKVLCVLISILLIVFSVPMTAFAEQEATYKTIPVEYSDNRKETEHLDVMIKNNNVFVNAEQLANRFSYDIEIDENKVSIKSLENPALPGVYVVFYFDDTKVTKMLYSDFCTKFEAPFASEKNEKGVWIPFEYSVLILNSGITILDDCVLIDIPEKTILDYFFDVQINSSRFNFDWAKDFGLDKVNVDIMGVSSHWTNMLNGVLAFDYLSWVQLFQTTNTLGMFTTAYDGKYGEKIATLICTQSDEEVKAVVNQIDEINDVFSDDGHLGNALKNYSKELDASTGSIYNSCNKLLEDIKSGNSSTAKYNKTYRELEKALDKQTWFSNSGERIVDVQKGLSKATAVLDIISYIADYLNCINEFQNQDDFSVSSLKSEIGDNHLYGNLLLHDMKASMKFYANQLSTDVGTYSAVQFIENNATKLFEKGTKVTAALGSKANYMLFAWNLASNFVPFFSEGLKATDNFELAMYSQIFQSDAYINYMNLKNRVFLNNDSLTSEDLYKVSQYCYIYLKSCYVTRNAALGSILPDKKEKMSTIIDTQNETNKEIAEIMAHIKNADIENKNNAYGFLLSDNARYISEYSDDNLAEFVKRITNYDYSIYIGKWESVFDNNGEIDENYAMVTSVTFNSINGTTADLTIFRGNITKVCQINVTGEIIDGKIKFSYDKDSWGNSGHGIITLNENSVYLYANVDSYAPGARIGLACDEILTRIYVIDAFNETFSYYSYTVNCRLPKILLDSKDAVEANEYILNRFKDSIDESRSCYEMHNISYSYSINNNILSLVVKDHIIPSTNISYYLVYNFDLSTNLKLNREEFLKKNNINWDRILKEIKEIYKQKLPEWNQSGSKDQKYYNDNISDLYINLTELYFDNGKLYAICYWNSMLPYSNPESGKPDGRYDVFEILDY